MNRPNRIIKCLNNYYHVCRYKNFATNILKRNISFKSAYELLKSNRNSSYASPKAPVQPKRFLADDHHSRPSDEDFEKEQDFNYRGPYVDVSTEQEPGRLDDIYRGGKTGDSKDEEVFDPRYNDRYYRNHRRRNNETASSKKKTPFITNWYQQDDNPNSPDIEQYWHRWKNLPARGEVSESKLRKEYELAERDRWSKRAEPLREIKKGNEVFAFDKKAYGATVEREKGPERPPTRVQLAPSPFAKVTKAAKARKPSYNKKDEQKYWHRWDTCPEPRSIHGDKGTQKINVYKNQPYNPITRDYHRPTAVPRAPIQQYQHQQRKHYGVVRSDLYYSKIKKGIRPPNYEMAIKNMKIKRATAPAPSFSEAIQANAQNNLRSGSKGYSEMNLSDKWQLYSDFAKAELRKKMQKT